jgi:molybdate transport system substrate-binding protein
MKFLSRLCLLLALCSLPVMAQEPARPLTVFAAASLKESVDAVAADWMKRSGQKIVVSYGASSALARQIERDAPADIYISADEDWMDYLAMSGRIDAASRFDLVGNRLVLVAPLSSPLQKVDLRRTVEFSRALGSDGRLAVADIETVPAGKYARQALTSLGLWQAVAPRLAQGENVRAALAFVARGEAPLGIVYATDARAEPKVRVLASFAPATHARIAYPAARLKRADAAASRGFLAFLRGPAARAIFLRAGFSAP